MSVPTRLAQAARERSGSRMAHRELLAQAAVGVPFVAVAVLLAALASDRRLDATDVLLFVLAATIAGRMQFETGAGLVFPAQLVFVPMLFVLSPAIVPLVVAGALVLDRLPEVVAGRLHPARLLGAACDAWFSVGPAAVFAIAGVHGPSWGDWPIYLLALAAQFAGELLSATALQWLARGAPPKLDRAALQEIWLVDVMLAPVGLLAAFASVHHRGAFLLVLALALLLAILARERRGRIGTETQLSETYRGTALLLGDVIAEDPELSSTHPHDVVALALAIADELRIDGETRRLVELAAMLHDIGKIETPREILAKPGPLDEAEWEAMRGYTAAGQRMLARVGGTLTDVGLVVRSACERYGGDGYPDALAGEQIPLASRVVAVAAAYGAMRTRRPYRAPLQAAAAIAELRANSATQFDPQVVRAACALLANGLPGVARPVEAGL
ncbi:MAG TPA: HD domain-containing phosphohydrolase [Solirubrobacteraceae bacterium]|jgi:HD-GYP domain-containing protein (c-di-GMP phosphodiesterase class II)